MFMDIEPLREGGEIAAVLRATHQRAGHLVSVHLRPSGESRNPRLAVVASRRVGGAVARNRAKRLLREASRRISWAPGSDVVLVARAACADSTNLDVLAELEVLVEKLGVAHDGGGGR